VYVSDFNNYRIQQFDSDDTFISKWGSKGEEDGQFNYPDDIAVDSGYVYVSDRMNHHIQVFSPSIN
jgi:sugar lactone lactonase YvrE